MPRRTPGPGNHAKHGRRDLVAPRQQHRGPGVDDHDGLGARRGDPVDQLVLPTRQRQTAPVEALALDLLGGAYHDHREVGGGRVGDRVGQGGVLVLDGAVDGQLHRHEEVLAGCVVLDEVDEGDPDRLPGGEGDRRPLLGRPHQALDRVGTGRQLEQLVERRLVVEPQPVAADPRGADAVAHRSGRR